MKVTVLDDYQRVALRCADWSPVAARAEIDVRHDHLADPEALQEALKDSEVVVLMRERTPMPASVLSALPALQLIVTTGPFNAAVDLATARSRGVVICGTGGAVEPTVELTWALILGLARHIAVEDAAVRSGSWQSTVGTDLAGRVLGLAGLGRIGSRVARIGAAFGMPVLAWSQNLNPDRAEAKGVRPVSKAELLAESDVLTIHLVLSERTRRLFGPSELSAMKSTALLVNTSRGPIVDEIALAEALRTGQIAGAALDVFGTEPLPDDHPLRTAPNTLLTPHIGYVSDRLYELFYREVVEDIVAYLDGEPIRVIEP